MAAKTLPIAGRELPTEANNVIKNPNIMKIMCAINLGTSYIVRKENRQKL